MCIPFIKNDFCALVTRPHARIQTQHTEWLARAHQQPHTNKQTKQEATKKKEDIECNQITLRNYIDSNQV